MTRNTNYPLPAGHTLTVTVVDGSAHVRQIEDPTIQSRVTNAAPVVFGPYFLARSFRVQESGNAAVVIAEADQSANLPTAAEKAALDAIPDEDAEDSATVFNDGGVLKVSSAGV